MEVAIHEHDECAELISERVEEFNASGVVVCECKVAVGYDDDGNDSVYVTVTLQDPGEDQEWPVAEITRLRDVVSKAANSAICSGRVYMRLAVQHPDLCLQ